MKLGTVEFAEWCFNEGVRIGAIFDVAASHDGDSAISEVDDLLDYDLDDEELEQLGRESGIPEGFGINRETFLETIASERICGFWVNVEREVRAFSNGGSYSSSWGHCNTKRFFSKDLDESLVSQISEWSADLTNQEMAKLKLVGTKGD